MTNHLYAKGRVLGFKRAKRNQRPDISLIQIEGVKTAADTDFYLGKRIAFVYRAKREVNGSKIRCIWGRITRAHGGSGAVKARFRNNLPAKSFGASVRVSLSFSSLNKPMEHLSTLTIQKEKSGTLQTRAMILFNNAGVVDKEK
ncbi:ribosomal protein L35Ae-domain-containing protein [Dissophora ornata]|nr:ribosomal protein L35Ae-domain-containing protein [Dissophora ornata]